MDILHLHTWSQWTVDERKEWLYSQSPENLQQLLTIVEDMIIDCPETEEALKTLVPSSIVMDTWKHICDILSDLKKSIEAVLLLERAT